MTRLLTCVGACCSPGDSRSFIKIARQRAVQSMRSPAQNTHVNSRIRDLKSKLVEGDLAWIDAKRIEHPRAGLDHERWAAEIKLDGGEVRVVIEREEKTTLITVENTGSEIDPRVLPRLFDRFYRADPARTHPESNGAGLGLSITKAIVEANGGSAKASSDSKKTSFCLEFPSST